MPEVVVTLPYDLVAELDAQVAASERSRTEIIVEAVARYLLEERLTIDRIIMERSKETEAWDEDKASTC